MTVPLSLPDIAGQLALLLRATLLIGAAWAAAAALRRAGASSAARHMAWLLGIAALLALPVLWWLLPALRLPILPAQAATAAAAAPPPDFASAGPVSPGVPIHEGWSVVLLLVYALGAATLLLRLVVGRRMLRRLWSEAGTVSDPTWETLLSELSSRMRLARRVELRIARGPAVPMTWGTLAPKLLLPAEASEWPPERRRLVLLHELAHVARRDSLSRSVASLACALYWFHPGAWFAARRMRLEQEHAADDRVLMAGGSAQAYALSLLDLAGGPGARRPRFDQAAAMAGMDQLERRLVSITSPAHRHRPGTFFLSSSALTAGLTTIFVAAGVPVGASPALPGPLQAKRPGMASPADKTADSGLAEGSTRARHTEGVSAARTGPGDAAERFDEAGRIASQSRPTARDMPERRLATRDLGARRESAPTPSPEEDNRDRRPLASAQPIRDYGWELPRRELQVRSESRAASQPARITLPARLYSDSGDRTGPPRWSRSVPKLVRGRPPTGSPLSQGPLVLSWSIGGK